MNPLRIAGFLKLPEVRPGVITTIGVPPGTIVVERGCFNWATPEAAGEDIDSTAPEEGVPPPTYPPNGTMEAEAEKTEAEEDQRTRRRPRT